jgi:NAD(P)-dependent dehydrogenase (short-subunit alcohol dehydrogenase family)
MAGLLERHIAAITGSGSGIGRAIALGYAREGAQVMALDINGEAAAQTAEAISRAGGKARSFVLDVRERNRCREVAALVEEKVGPISILVNDAGINRRNAFTADREAVIKDWEDILATNLYGRVQRDACFSITTSRQQRPRRQYCFDPIVYARSNAELSRLYELKTRCAGVHARARGRTGQRGCTGQRDRAGLHRNTT